MDDAERFCEITHCDLGEAVRYLEMAEGNFENALHLFFDSGTREDSEVRVPDAVYTDQLLDDSRTTKRDARRELEEMANRMKFDTSSCDEETSKNVALLNEQFGAPSYNCEESFETVVQIAKVSKQFIIANIQSSEVFFFFLSSGFYFTSVKSRCVSRTSCCRIVGTEFSILAT